MWKINVSVIAATLFATLFAYTAGINIMAAVFFCDTVMMLILLFILLLEFLGNKMIDRIMEGKKWKDNFINTYDVLETAVENMEESFGGSNMEDSPTYKFCKQRLEDFREDIKNV